MAAGLLPVALGTLTGAAFLTATAGADVLAPERLKLIAELGGGTGEAFFILKICVQIIN